MECECQATTGCSDLEREEWDETPALQAQAQTATSLDRSQVRRELEVAIRSAVQAAIRRQVQQAGSEQDLRQGVTRQVMSDFR